MAPKKSADIPVFLFLSKANPHTYAYDSILSPLFQASPPTIISSPLDSSPLNMLKTSPVTKQTNVKVSSFLPCTQSRALSYSVLLKLL